MASFKATLDIEGTLFNILKVDYRFSRDIDKNGNAASTVYGGTVEVTVESTDNNYVVENMLNNQSTPIGSAVFTFPYSNKEGTMKELTLEEVYVVDYKESLDAEGEKPMSIAFKLSARVMKLGEAVLEKNWEGQPVG